MEFLYQGCGDLQTGLVKAAYICLSLPGVVIRGFPMASLKEYLKRYESNSAVEEKKKKKKKKKLRTDAAGVLIVDEDPVWQKAVVIDEEEENESPDEKPQVDEDIEIKRMKRLEQLRAKRPYHAISEDGSGWVSLTDGAIGSDVAELNEPSTSRAIDLSPPRQRQHRKRFDSLSPEPLHEAKMMDSDLSPPRQKRRPDSASPAHKQRPYDSSADVDLSPPRQHRRRHDSDTDLSPPRQHQRQAATSLPQRSRRRYDSGSPDPDRKTLKVNDQSVDISPPRRPQRKNTVDYENLNASDAGDLSRPRRDRRSSPSVSKSRGSMDINLSPLKKKMVPDKTGLVTGKDIKEELSRKKQEELSKLKLLNDSVIGAETVYRDKLKGVRISKDEYIKSQKKEEKPKEEKKLEWGKGLAQKREAEAKLLDMEIEKDKPFARSRDDPDLDRSLKEAIRWGDPMAHLVKRKQSGLVLPDLGDDEKMKESGFIIPQEIPIHSWIKRGMEAAPNRYGIKPGRHWDGVDRSNGYEKELFKRMNNKRATEREAYLWNHTFFSYLI
ncbi:hypothetical protein V2J09_003524 [Rumex salicifolius]